jgi:hypothetical protein
MVKNEQVAFSQRLPIQVIGQLLQTLGVGLGAAPDFEFGDVFVL